MGIFNLTLNEKIADAALSWAEKYGIQVDFSKDELITYAKSVIPIYQNAVVAGTIPVYSDTLPLSEKDKITDILISTTGLPGGAIYWILQGLFYGVQYGDIQAKELQPNIVGIKRVTATDPTKFIEQYTPKSLFSILNFDVPQFVEKNLLLLSATGIIGIILINQLKKKGVTHGRIT